MASKRLATLFAVLAAFVIALSPLFVDHASAAQQTDVVETVLPDGTVLSTCINGSADPGHHVVDHCALCTLVKAFAMPIGQTEWNVRLGVAEVPPIAVRSHGKSPSPWQSLQARAPPESIQNPI